MTTYSHEMMDELLKVMPGWEIQDGRLYRLFKFKNFQEAFAFMTRVALLAEKADHHPDWFNSYNKVEIRLYTHSQNGLTEKDFNLASEIDGIQV